MLCRLTGVLEKHAKAFGPLPQHHHGHLRKEESRAAERTGPAAQARKEPLAALPGDIEVNPDNYDAGKLREDRPPQPSKVPVYKGTQLYLTKNTRKKDDYVNGVLCYVEAWSDALRVTTTTGKRLYVTPWTDAARGNVTYYPIRLG